MREGIAGRRELTANHNALSGCFLKRRRRPEHHHRERGSPCADAHHHAATLLLCLLNSLNPRTAPSRYHCVKSLRSNQNTRVEECQSGQKQAQTAGRGYGGFRWLGSLRRRVRILTDEGSAFSVLRIFSLLRGALPGFTKPSRPLSCRSGFALPPHDDQPQKPAALGTSSRAILWYERPRASRGINTQVSMRRHVVICTATGSDPASAHPASHSGAAPHPAGSWRLVQERPDGTALPRRILGPEITAQRESRGWQGVVGTGPAPG